MNRQEVRKSGSSARFSNIVMKIIDKVEVHTGEWHSWKCRRRGRERE
jgi:hypothetical protein